MENPRFFDTPLDFETYRSLNELIHETFEPFVNVELLVQTRDGSSKKLPAYWTYAIQNSTNLKPAVREFLQGQAPHLEKEKWLIPTQNQVVNGLLSEQVLAELNKEFRRYGFFNIKFTTKVDETNIDENLRSLEQEQAQHESAMQEFYEKQPAEPKKKMPVKSTRMGNKRSIKKLNLFKLKTWKMAVET